MTKIRASEERRPDESPGGLSDRVCPIVVGVDGSPDSVAAAHWASQLASTISAGVELVHVYTHHDFTTPRFFPSERAAPAYVPEVGAALRHEEVDTLRQTQLVRDCERAAADELVAEAAQIVRDESPGVALACRVIESDDVGRALVTEAEGASLLVVGSHGAGAFRGLLGSVGAYVTRHARCPVTVVPDDKRGSREPQPM